MPATTASRSIEAAQFVEAARARGFSRYAGVPCSYLTPFINYVIQDASLDYIGAANEGDAVAISAGVALGGERAVTMMQNSGLGNAVSPLTSLTWTFGLPQLLIITWRGEPGGASDEPQHALMGPITPTMLDTMDVAWELFPTDPAEVDAVLDRACAHMDATGKPYALLMKKGSVAPFPLQGSGAPTPRPMCVPETAYRSNGDAEPDTLLPIASRGSRTDALRRVAAASPLQSESPAGTVTSAPTKTVVLATTGFTGRELYALDDRANQLYMVGSMGCIATLGLGLARARPDVRVIAIDGDGAALMRMGLFATVGTYGSSNLLHLLLDNGAHDSTGGQATVSAGVGFAQIAAACGYASAADSDDLDVIERWIAGDDVAAETPSRDAGAQPVGARFLRIFTRPGSPETLPRPSVTPRQVRARLQHYLGITTTIAAEASGANQ
ncbi:phosphonopyruvate decarboxylase [Robbsia sp. KACC 23696]|uniref:phosphonopyruvate decarboxylase n=1 Tax=Robbsia sp. KACC 23696 TaxID=3149231 RepID=UPI00325AC649